MRITDGGPMRIIVRVLSAIVLLCFTLSAQEEPKPAAVPASSSAADSKIPPEAAKLPNPVKPSPASLAQGKKSYGFDCAVCHGKDGDGKGDLAADMNLKLADYRDPAALKDFTDGELFYIIKNGKGQMTGEGDRSKPDEIWNMVNYVRSLAKKGAVTASKPPGS
jgi:mono/diheme cytochrome c family protein